MNDIKTKHPFYNNKTKPRFKDYRNLETGLKPVLFIFQAGSWRLKDGLINRHAKKAKTSKLQKCFWIEKGQRCAFKQNDEWEKVFFAERPKSVSPEFSGLNEAQADATSHLMRDMAAGSRIFPDWKGSKFKSSFSF